MACSKFSTIRRAAWSGGVNQGIGSGTASTVLCRGTSRSRLGPMLASRGCEGRYREGPSVVVGGGWWMRAPTLHGGHESPGKVRTLSAAQAALAEGELCG